MTDPSSGFDSDGSCVNDLLYYLNFKRRINAVDDVVATCVAFYSPDAILCAKKLFFSAVGEHEGIKFTSRRGPNPAKTNLEDLINAMYKCDNDGIRMPKFLSSDLTNVPQNNDGNASLNQLLFMIIEMKKQFSNLEKKVVCKCNDVTNIADASTSSPNAPSIPPSIDPSPTESTDQSADLVVPVVAETDPSASKTSFAAVANIPSRITPTELKKALNVVLPSGNKNEKQTKRTAENRIKTNYDKNKNVVIGKKPSSGVMSWGGAPLTMDCYIGRVDCSVNSDQIKTSVVAMGIDVVDIEENLTRHGLFKSFKLVIKKTDFSALNSPEIWPEGVVFRRFRRPRPPTTGHDDSPNSH